LDGLLSKPLTLGKLVYVRYWDHLRFNHPHPETLMPVTREAVGWLVYQCSAYLIISLDRSADPPPLKGGDPNVLGHVLLRGEVLELRSLDSEGDNADSRARIFRASAGRIGKPDAAPRSQGRTPRQPQQIGCHRSAKISTLAQPEQTPSVGGETKRRLAVS
jgi:hypothetical protein